MSRPFSWYGDSLVDHIRHVAQGDSLDLAASFYRDRAGTYCPVDLYPGMVEVHQRWVAWGVLAGPYVGNARGWRKKAKPHDRLRTYWKVAPVATWDALEALHRMGGWFEEPPRKEPMIVVHTRYRKTTC